MDDNDLDSVRHKPDFKDILRAVLKHQMKYLVEQLSKYGGDEVLVLATNLSGGVVSHLGSAATRGFLDNRDDIKSQFLGHCIRNNLQERSTVPGSVNSSLTASQTDIPHTQQYIAAGSTHGCVVPPEIAVDSSSTFTRTLPAIRTKTVEFNRQPNNNIKTPPKFGLHYMQSQLEQMSQRVCNNKFTKAPMTATSSIVKPRTGMKRSCETVTSENSLRRKIVHNDGSDLGCKETTTPTSHERSNVHKDDNKLTLDDKDDSIFDDYVMGQFDATEKESEVPDNDPVPDSLDQVQPINSDLTENADRTSDVVYSNTLEILIDGRKELIEVNTKGVPMDLELCRKQIIDHIHSRKTNATESMKESTVESTRKESGQSVHLKKAPNASHMDHYANVGNSKPISDEAQNQTPNHMRKDTARSDNREVSCQSMAEITSDEIECVGDKRNRKSYCLAFKLEAIKYAEENGTCKAEKLYKIRESTIRGWRKQKQDIQALCQVKETGKFQLNRTSLRTAQWPELEEKLLVYVLKQKSEGKMLRQTSVLKIAVKIAKQSGIADFKASPGWLQRFKQRHGLYDTG